MHQLIIPSSANQKKLPLVILLDFLFEAGNQLVGCGTAHNITDECIVVIVERFFVMMRELCTVFGPYFVDRAHVGIHIQELAGHSDLTTTMRYMHLSPSERERSARSTHGELTPQ